MTPLSLSERLRRRSEYLRPPSEAADRQVRSFSVHSLEALLRLVSVNPAERILNLGGTVGVLAVHMASALNQPEQLLLVESDGEYFSAAVPKSLHYKTQIERITGDPLHLSLPKNSFDRVIVHDFVRWFLDDELEFLLDEFRRLLDEDGSLLVIEEVGRREWIPETIHSPEAEVDRAGNFRSIVRELNQYLEPGLERPVQSLPEDLRQEGWSINAVDGWFQPVRLNDERWTERQRTDLINLRHQARRDRLEGMRKLMEAVNFWSSDYGPLFRQLASDYQQQSLRLRKALETNEETGWTGFESVIISATPD